MIFLAHSYSEAYGAENQDASICYQFDADTFFAAVADGVGGHAGGKIASNIAVETASDLLRNDINKDFSEIFEKICLKIEEISLGNPDLTEMATTLSIVIIHGKKARFGHVGDSRIYHLRGEGIKQVTEDQSEVALLIRQGILNKKTALNYHRKSVLYSALSIRRNFEINEGTFSVKDADRILLITDGVYRLVSKAEIRDFSLSRKNINFLVDEVIGNIKKLQPKDDYTVVGIEALLE